MENTIYEQNTKQVEYAGFWWRFLAYLIDSIIISFVSWIIFIPVFAIFGISIYSLQEAGFDADDAGLMLLPMIGFITTISMLGTVMQWLYFALMESSKYQGTIGKLALKIKVTGYQGEKISFARATGRYFAKIISSMIILIGYIMAGFTEKKQALHDILASCYVIKE